MEAPLVSASSKSKISFQLKPPRLVRWGFHHSDHGYLFLGVSEEGALCIVSFMKNRNDRSNIKFWKDKWPKTEFIKNQTVTDRVMKTITNSRKTFDLTMVGTRFQQKVWKAIIAIPFGKTKSYAEIAKSINNSKAVRAVGTACGSNPIPLIIPCHRVVGSNGRMGGYGGGLRLKKQLLNVETD